MLTHAPMPHEPPATCKTVSNMRCQGQQQARQQQQVVGVGVAGPEAMSWLQGCGQLLAQRGGAVCARKEHRRKARTSSCCLQNLLVSHEACCADAQVCQMLQTPCHPRTNPLPPEEIRSVQGCSGILAPCPQCLNHSQLPCQGPAALGPCATVP